MNGTEPLLAAIARLAASRNPNIATCLAEALLKVCVELTEQDLCDESIRLYSGIIPWIEGEDSVVGADVAARARYNRVLALETARGIDAAIDGDQLLAESAAFFGTQRSPTLRAHAMNAYYLRGAIRRARGDAIAAVAEWDAGMEVWRGCELPDSPEIQVPLGRVLVSNGAAHHELGQLEEAQRDYQSVFNYCHNIDDPRVLTSVCDAATGLTKVALDHGGAELFELALKLLQSVIQSGLPREDEDVQVATAEAMAMKANVESTFGRNEAAISTNQTIVDRFLFEFSCVLIVAEALFNQGCLLEKLGQSDDAASVYDQLVAEFSDVEHSVVQELITKAKARCNPGSAPT